MAVPATDERKAWRLAVSCVVWAMYGVSLALPAAEPYAGTDQILGYEALLMSLDWPRFFWPVLANLALLAGWIGYMVRQSMLALIGGITGLVLSLLAIPLLASPPAEFLAGYWLWVGTMALFALAAAVEFFWAEK